MAGAMNEECFPFRPLLTEHLLLGTPLPQEVSRHLGRCPDCTREAAETDDVVRTLRRANPLADWTRPQGAETRARPSRDLGDRIRRDVVKAKTARTSRGQRIALGVAAALVTVAAAVLVPLTADQDHRAPHTSSVVMVRQGQMVDRAWGTEVPVALSGLEAGQTYRMMTVNAEGTRAPGGSVRATTGESISLRMVTAMRKDTIIALIVEDAKGHVVTHVLVTPSTSG
ncbi:hypothetical protein [Embleya sp. NBC_00896]|uniref:hypothetical protein n=1 Tax=Embleya sp. NBC_00896 TaxID=2975961 RepID=UPI002F90A38F|nr:hypothetical protein OG928_45130 [Embleya sp. NBC_00896]